MNKITLFFAALCLFPIDNHAQFVSMDSSFAGDGVIQTNLASPTYS